MVGPKLFARLGMLAALSASLGSSFAGVGVAWAQEQDELELLRRRFREGMALEEQGKWAEALAAFLEVAEKKQSAQVLFHVALCQEQLKQLVLARKGYADALKLAEQDPQGAKEVLDAVPNRVASLDARIPRLVLLVSEQGQAEVQIDDQPATLVNRRATLSVDPGQHRIALSQRGETKPFRTITLAEGEQMEITIPARVVEDPGPPEPKPAKDPAPEPSTTPGTKVPFFVVGGVGLASLVASGVMVGLRQASISEVRDACSDGDTGCDPSVQEVAERGQAYERAAWGLGIAGVACLGAATVLYFTVGQDSPATPAQKTGVSLRISPFGLALAGAFE